MPQLFDLATAAGIREINAYAAFDFKDGAWFGLWLSLVERLPRVQEAAGSNPASPILSRAAGREMVSIFCAGTLGILWVGLDYDQSLR